MRFLFFVALTTSQATAAPTDAVRDALTGGANRTWDVEGRPWIAHLGGGCEGGERWTFSTDGTWCRSVCKDGTESKLPGYWSWAEDEANDHRIVIDGATYILDIRRKPSDVDGDPDKLLLTLRTRKRATDDLTYETRLVYQAF